MMDEALKNDVRHAVETYSAWAGESIEFVDCTVVDDKLTIRARWGGAVHGVIAPLKTGSHEEIVNEAAEIGGMFGVFAEMDAGDV